MRSAAGVRLCRRRHFSTSSPLGWPRGRSRGLRRGGGAGPGGASRMLRAAPSPSRTRPGARRGRPSHRHRTLAPPPPAGRSVPPPPRPRNGPSRLSALPALCSPPPSAVAVRGARAEQGTEWPRCRWGSDFSRIRAANSADPFLWLVLGCGVVGGEVRRGAFGTRSEGVEDAVARTPPGDCTPRRVWLRSKPGGGESGFLSASLS